MGTGLGPESYAIIDQGRIGQLLSSKPTDRRGIIEEAAGSQGSNEKAPCRTSSRIRSHEPLASTTSSTK